MSISQALLAEFDQEMAGMRKALERVPEGKTDWKPHEKSMSMGRLAGHLAELPNWAIMTMTRDEIDFAGEYKPFVCSDPKELLAKFDELSSQARAAIAAGSDADFMKTWTLKFKGQKLMAMPKIAVLRNMVMNHMIHHRGQLTVYLRLNDRPVPSLYGPSADENPFAAMGA